MSSRNGQQRMRCDAVTSRIAALRAIFDKIADWWGDVQRPEVRTGHNTPARHASSRAPETADAKRGGERWAPRLSACLS